MEKRKRKSILWTIGILVVVLFLFLAPFLLELRTGQSSGASSFLSASAQRGDIYESYYGSGTLTAQNSVSVTVPDGVLLKEYLVKDGETVEAGQTLALTDRVSVMEAITKVQETLNLLNDQLSDAADAEAATNVTAQVGGRVMAVYASEGSGAQDTMLASGALAIVSLDGKLAVDFPCETGISVGDTVTVVLPDGSEVAGRVDAALAGTTTVTISDDGPSLSDSVTIRSEAGAVLGSGTLYVHSAWRAEAYTGTVSQVHITVGDEVSDGATLFTLKDTADESEYRLLSAKHRVYEDILTELFVLYQDGAVTAQAAGQVTLQEDTAPYLLSAQAQAYAVTFLSNAPMGDADAQYTNMLGIVTACNYNALTLNMNLAPVEVADYQSVPLSPDAMTTPTTISPDPATPVFTLIDGQWQQDTLAAVAVGDTLLFAYADADQPVWIVRVAQATADPDKPQDTPTIPDDTGKLPADGTTPNGTVTIPNGMDMSGFTIPSGTGSTGSFSMPTQATEEEQALYSDAETEILTVTPCETLYLELTVDELDILQAQAGQTANVTIDALPGRSFEATVTDISAQGENLGGSSKFTVKLRLPREEDMLPGMNASAEVPLDCHTDVLTIPVAALCDRGGKVYVYRSYDKEAGLGSLCEVTPGISDGDQVEILDGLQENDTIWYEYYDKPEISNNVAQNPQQFFQGMN